MRGEVESGNLNVLAVKEDFAKEVVGRFHSAEAAEIACAARKQVAAGGIPEDTPELRVEGGGDGLWVAKALSAAGLDEWALALEREDRG